MSSTYDKRSNCSPNVPPTHKQSIRNTTVCGVRDLVDEQRYRTRKASRSAPNEEPGHDEANIIVNTTQSHSQSEEAVSYVYS